MMLEADRLAYLNALGITQYVALNPIAGAQQLPVLAPEQIWPEPDATHDAKGDHTAAQALQHGLQSNPADQRDQVQKRFWVGRQILWFLGGKDFLASVG